MSKYKFDTTDLPLIEVVDENGTVVTSIDAVSALTDTVDNLRDDVEKIAGNYKRNVILQAIKAIGNCNFHDFEDLNAYELFGIVKEQYLVPDDGKVYKPNDKHKFVYSADKRIWRMYLINKDGTEEVGGWVENPQYLLGDENWVGENAVLKGICVLKDCDVIGNSQVIDSVFINSTVCDSLVSDSFVQNSRVLANSEVIKSFIKDSSTEASYLHSMSANDTPFIHDYFSAPYDPESSKRLHSPEDNVVSYTVENVGTAHNTLTVGFLSNGELIITRGCFSGTLKEFKKAINRDPNRSIVESRYYYQMVRYLVKKLEAEHNPDTVKELLVVANKTDELMKLVNKLTVVSLLKGHAFKDWVLDKLIPLINDLERGI